MRDRRGALGPGPRSLEGQGPHAAGSPATTIGSMTTSIDRLPFTGDDEADRLLVSEPLALLIGFALDQQVTVQKAFSGPAELKRRLGHLDAAADRGDGPRHARCRVPRATGTPPVPGLDGRQGPAARGGDRRRLRQRRQPDLDGRGRRARPRATPARPARDRRDEGQEPDRRSWASDSGSTCPGWRTSSRGIRRSEMWTPRRRLPPTRPASERTRPPCARRRAERTGRAGIADTKRPRWRTGAVRLRGRFEVSARPRSLAADHPGTPVPIADPGSGVDAEAHRRHGKDHEGSDEDGRREGGHREVDGHWVALPFRSTSRVAGRS